jgi:hypothetical protein
MEDLSRNSGSFMATVEELWGRYHGNMTMERLSWKTYPLEAGFVH